MEHHPVAGSKAGCGLTAFLIKNSYKKSSILWEWISVIHQPILGKTAVYIEAEVLISEHRDR
jgi:hypothetical protein